MKLIPDSLISRRWFDALSTLEFGSLKFVTPDGEVHFFQGRQPGAKADFHIRDWDVIRNAAARGDIGLGEDYIDGAWETSDIEALFIESQARVTGTVTVLLRPGSAFVEGTDSKYSLMAASKGVYGEATGEWTPADALGFSRIVGLPGMFHHRAGIQGAERP